MTLRREYQQIADYLKRIKFDCNISEVEPIVDMDRKIVGACL